VFVTVKNSCTCYCLEITVYVTVMK